VYNSNQKWKILKIKKKNFFFHFFENYALVCKGHACYRLFSYIIIKLRHGTNCWSWFWVYNSNQKWKILKIRKKIFFSFFFWKKFFSLFLIFGQLTVCKSNKIFKTSPFLKNSKHKTVKKLKKFKKTKKNFLQKNWKKN